MRPMNRRALLGHGAAGIAALLGALGCRKNQSAALVCEGLPDISPSDAQLRATLEYLDTAPQPDRSCENCQLFIPASSEGTCGSCKVVRGPIHPKGTCKVFLRKVGGGAPT